VQNSSDIIAVMAADSSIFTSPSIKQILGYEPEDWLGKRLLNLCIPMSSASRKPLDRSLIVQPPTQLSFVYGTQMIRGKF